MLTTLRIYSEGLGQAVACAEMQLFVLILYRLSVNKYEITWRNSPHDFVRVEECVSTREEWVVQCWDSRQ
jgi:hypothetical protein